MTTIDRREGHTTAGATETIGAIEEVRIKAAIEEAGAATTTTTMIEAEMITGAMAEEEETGTITAKETSQETKRISM